MPDFSFDIVSEVNLQEVRNAIDQASREIATRYDFKGSVSEIRQEKNLIHLHSDDEYKLKAVIDVLNPSWCVAVLTSRRSNMARWSLPAEPRCARL